MRGGIANNCTFSSNSASYGGGMHSGTANNCISWYNSAGISGDDLYNTTANYTCSPDVSHGSSGCITNAPVFSSPATADFTLSANSPCMDAGHNAYAPGEADLAGNPRIIGSFVDMGAYEYHGSAVPDSDGDGLPDWWEELYFSGATNANPSATCSNGVNSVWQAYIAGLDPTSPTNCFLLQVLQPPPSVLRWNSVSGRVYNIYWTTNLLEDFQPLETNYTGGAITDLLHGAGGKCFYKIEVQMDE